MAQRIRNEVKLSDKFTMSHGYVLIEETKVDADTGDFVIALHNKKDEEGTVLLVGDHSWQNSPFGNMIFKTWIAKFFGFRKKINFNPGDRVLIPKKPGQEFILQDGTKGKAFIYADIRLKIKEA